MRSFRWSMDVEARRVRATLVRKQISTDEGHVSYEIRPGGGDGTKTGVGPRSHLAHIRRQAREATGQ